MPYSLYYSNYINKLQMIVFIAKQHENYAGVGAELVVKALRHATSGTTTLE